MAGHRFNPEKAGKLLDPKRKELISPQQVLSLLQMDQRDIVADLGAGNGYFTVPLAKTTKEVVYAIDVQPEMLELLKGHAEKEKVANIEYIVSDVTETPLPSHFIDKGIMAFVFHEIAEWDAAFDEIKRIMKPNGKFLLIDWETVESEMGPPLHEHSIRGVACVCENKTYRHATYSFSSSGVWIIVDAFINVNKDG